jgi:hypothetical protein
MNENNANDKSEWVVVGLVILTLIFIFIWKYYLKYY